MVFQYLKLFFNKNFLLENGFYLYSTHQLEVDNNKQCNYTNSDLIFIEEKQKLFRTNNTHKEDEDIVEVIIASLWYWWYVK